MAHAKRMKQNHSILHGVLMCLGREQFFVVKACVQEIKQSILGVILRVDQALGSRSAFFLRMAQEKVWEQDFMTKLRRITIYKLLWMLSQSW